MSAECGCKTSDFYQDGRNAIHRRNPIIVYCSKHQAVDQLLEAAKKAESDLRAMAHFHGGLAPDPYYLTEAIASAEEKEPNHE